MIEQKITDIVERLEQIGCQDIVCRNYLHQKKLIINFFLYGAKTELFFFRKGLVKKSLDEIDFYKGYWQITFYKSDEEIIKSDKLNNILKMISLPAFENYVKKNLLWLLLCLIQENSEYHKTIQHKKLLKLLI